MLNLEKINLSSDALIKDIKSMMMESVMINDTLTDKSILLSIVNNGGLTAEKSVIKELKKCYESTSEGKRFASSPCYKAIKTFEKRVNAKEFYINPFESAIDTLKAYKAFCKANKASLQDCLTLAEKQAKTAKTAEKVAESAESAESTESNGNEITVSDFLKLIKEANFTESELTALKQGIDSLKSQKKAA